MQARKVMMVRVISLVNKGIVVSMDVSHVLVPVATTAFASSLLGPATYEPRWVPMPRLP